MGEYVFKVGDKVILNLPRENTTYNGLTPQEWRSIFNGGALRVMRTDARMGLLHVATDTGVFSIWANHVKLFSLSKNKLGNFPRKTQEV